MSDAFVVDHQPLRNLKSLLEELVAIGVSADNSTLNYQWIHYEGEIFSKKRTSLCDKLDQRKHSSSTISRKFM